MTPHLAITGLGIVHASGIGPEPLRAALAVGRTRTAELSAFAPLRPRTARAALVGTLPPREELPALVARRMSPPSRYAVIAASDALADAGVAVGDVPDRDRAVVLATAFGPSSFTQLLLDQMFDAGPAAGSPSLFSECVASAPASWVGIRTRSAGPAVTIAAGESGPVAAVARACDLLRAERCTTALAGAVDEMTPLLLAVLDRFRSLSRATPKPLARERDGFLAAEGAGVVHVERLEDARRRGAVSRAAIVAWGTAHDPTALPSRWGSGGLLLGRALARSLSRADVHPESIDRIVCGASGSIAGDRAEAEMLREAWRGRPLPTLLAPKAVTGEYGGGFLAAAVLAAAPIDVAPIAHGALSDPELGVTPFAGGSLSAPQRVLVTTAASGGSAAWFVLEPS